MENQQSFTDTELNTYVNIGLKIDDLISTLDLLAKALHVADDKAKAMIADAVLKLRESGVQNLKAASQAEGVHGEVTQLYNRTIGRLQTAADKGDAGATQLLAEINP